MHFRPYCIQPTITSSTRNKFQRTALYMHHLFHFVFCLLFFVFVLFSFLLVLFCFLFCLFVYSCSLFVFVFDLFWGLISAGFVLFCFVLLCFYLFVFVCFVLFLRDFKPLYKLGRVWAIFCLAFTYMCKQYIVLRGVEWVHYLFLFPLV